jgi:excisionase family DNA binding protein
VICQCSRPAPHPEGPIRGAPVLVVRSCPDCGGQIRTLESSLDLAPGRCCPGQGMCVPAPSSDAPPVHGLQPSSTSLEEASSKSLTAAELARHLRVPIGQVYRLSSSGQIPKIKIGHRTVRFDLEAVLEALSESTESSSPGRRRPKIPPSERTEAPLPPYDWSPQPSPRRRGRRSVADRRD